MQVWIVPLDREPIAVLDLLSVEERARADRLRHAGARRDFIVSRAALRRVLGALLGLPPQAVELDIGAHGKPRLAAGGPHFNLSHSGDLALIAVCADHAVGVDLEQTGRGLTQLDAIAEAYFSPTERAAYAALPAADRGRAFYRVWTRKEAVAKALGLGMALSGPSFDVSVTAGEPRLQRLGGATTTGEWTLIDLDLPPAYVGAAVVMAGAHVIQREWLA